MDEEDLLKDLREASINSGDDSEDDDEINLYFWDGNVDSLPILTTQMEAMLAALERFGSFSGLGHDVAAEKVVEFQQHILEFKSIFEQVCANRGMKKFMSTCVTSKAFDTFPPSYSIEMILGMFSGKDLSPCNEYTVLAIRSILDRYKVVRVYKSDYVGYFKGKF